MATEQKEKGCWFRHDWPAKWGNPYTPPGYYETFAIQRRTCKRCNMTQQRVI